jgi:hypothetical protein
VRSTTDACRGSEAAYMTGDDSNTAVHQPFQVTFPNTGPPAMLPPLLADQKNGAMQSPLSDNELADRWERQELGGSGVSHIDHVRIAWVLHRRHGALEAEERLVRGTRRACDHYGVPDKFDERLTRRWAMTISDALGDAPDSESFQDFIDRNPELRRGDLYGKPRKPRPGE